MSDFDDPAQVNEMIVLANRLISDLEAPELPDQYAGNQQFVKLYNRLVDLRNISEILNKGKLDEYVYSKGYVISNLKALQANLRHLTWQTQRIAEGDFQQRVDFLGDFSTAFNEMTVKLAEYSNTLKNMANFDHLTKLPNRLYIDELLSRVFHNFKEADTPFSVVMFDIDYFKKINDTYGHSVGDIVLTQVGKLISSSFRSSDVCARYGGEEFIAVLPNSAIEQVVYIKVSKIIKDIRDTHFIINDALTVRITISAGISTVEASDKEYSAVVERADHALYQSKKQGRDRVTVV